MKMPRHPVDDGIVDNWSDFNYVLINRLNAADILQWINYQKSGAAKLASVCRLFNIRIGMYDVPYQELYNTLSDDRNLQTLRAMIDMEQL